MSPGSGDRGCGGREPGLLQRGPVPVPAPVPVACRAEPSPPLRPPEPARPLQGQSLPAEGTADRGIAPAPPQPPGVSPAWQRDVSDTSASAFDRPAAARLADEGYVCIGTAKQIHLNQF